MFHIILYCANSDELLLSVPSIFDILLTYTFVQTDVFLCPYNFIYEISNKRSGIKVRFTFSEFKINLMRPHKYAQCIMINITFQSKLTLIFLLKLFGWNSEFWTNKDGTRFILKRNKVSIENYD